MRTEHQTGSLFRLLNVIFLKLDPRANQAEHDVVWTSASNLVYVKVGGVR